MTAARRSSRTQAALSHMWMQQRQQQQQVLPVLTHQACLSLACSTTREAAHVTTVA
jgi:hypothetical protein